MTKNEFMRKFHHLEKRLSEDSDDLLLVSDIVFWALWTFGLFLVYLLVDPLPIIAVAIEIF